MSRKRTPTAALKASRKDSFLVLLSKNMDGKIMYAAPGVENAVFKAIVNRKSPKQLRDLEMEQLALLCPRATRPSNIERQLNYHMFKRDYSRTQWRQHVEMVRGKPVTLNVEYAMYVHTPEKGYEHTMWKNSRGAPHPKHWRTTNNEKKRSWAATKQDDRPAKREKDNKDAQVKPQEDAMFPVAVEGLCLKVSETVAEEDFAAWDITFTAHPEPGYYDQGPEIDVELYLDDLCNDSFITDAVVPIVS